MRHNYWDSELPIGNPHITSKVGKGLPQRYYEPSSTTLLVTSLVVTAISVATSVTGSIMQGIQEKKASEQRADVALRNAQVARANAAFNMEQEKKSNFRRLGAIKASNAAGGKQFAGSAIDIFQSSVIEGRINVDEIERQGELRAQGFFDEAEVHKTTGDNAFTSGLFNAAGDVIGGVGSAAGSFSSAKRLGLLNSINSKAASNEALV